jgi:YggT family protein
MNPLFYLLSTLLSLYGWVVIVWLILSWLISFNMVNRYHPFVGRAYDVLTRLTDPVLRYIRQVIPPIGGIDLSPILLFILIQFLEYSLHYYAYMR